MVMLTQKLQQLAENIPTDGKSFLEASDPTTDMGDKVGDILHEPTTAAPLPIALSGRESGRWVKLYNTRTHEEISVNVMNLPNVLKKRHKAPAYPDFVGKLLFSNKPLGVRILGSHKCLLHPDSPLRSELDRRGAASCPAEHLASEDQVTQHMAKRHKAEWGTIQRERQEAERQEDREVARKQADAMMVMMEKMAGGAIKSCDKCEYVASGKTGIEAFNDLRRHTKEKHETADKK